ncbi:MAG: glutamate--tRNA ligase [bacterium]
MTSSVRVRFAPSPTGRLHIGNARTAILNWLFANKCGGQFILRIEDTDAERSSLRSEKSILEDLEWLGVEWQEGPDIGGPHGPYRQSERKEIYREYLNTLADKKLAYPCYCTRDELDEKRQAALAQGENPFYDGKCLRLTEKERADFERAGRKPVWRFRVSPGEIKWEEPVKGALSFDGASFGDFVILRTDGIPTYNFAAVVDDALMKVTHVVRGDDHVSNTPKQILLFQALEFEIPKFVHIPMILGPDRTRLAKRHGATSIQEFREKGYLPEALVNFLSLLSWSSESGDELLSFRRLVDEFDFNRMSKSPAIFDGVKLDWMNGQYIRDLETDRLLEVAKLFLHQAGTDVSDQDKLQNVLSLIKGSLERIDQVVELARPFFEDGIDLSDGQAIALCSKDSSQKIYWAFLRYLDQYGSLTADIFRAIMKQVQKDTGIMGKDLWMPIRVALTGQLHGPELAKVAEIMGKRKCERFIRKLIG